MILGLLLSGTAYPAEGKEAFIGGIRLYEAKRYEAAAGLLADAAKTLPSVADYALLYGGKALLEGGRPGEAASAARDILRLYPDSPLKKDARNILIMGLLSSGAEADALDALDAYAKDFPSDGKMRHLLGTVLKKKNPQRAKAVFKELYIDAAQYSAEALRELSPGDITAADALLRTSNLLKAFRYKEAESSLRELIGRGGEKDKAVGLLAQALFGQKKYKEAGASYLEAGDIYGAARSFLRAGEREKFDAAVAKLLSAGDERAGGLLIAYAADKRREGDTEGALRLLKEAGKLPAAREEALWGAGWLYYLGGSYGEAHAALSELCRKNPSAKYLYWKARTVEKMGGEAGELYGSLDENDFYGVLARMSGRAVKPSGARKTALSAAVPAERVDLLLEAGLNEDAVRELLHMAGNGRSGHAETAFRLKEMGRYKDAIALLRKLPEDMRPDDILYPLAYWQTVGDVSSEWGIDPYLVLSVIREESRFDPVAYSPAGAYGLMQLMPETAERTAARLRLSPYDLGDAMANIRLGAFYLNGLVKELGSVTAALAAYNAGEHNARKWLGRKYGSPDEFIEDIPFEETKKYIKRIITTYSRYRKVPDYPEAEAMSFF